MRLTFVSFLLAITALFSFGCGAAESFDGGVQLPAGTADGASWSPDGRWIAIPNKRGVLLRGVDGNGRKQLSAPPVRRFKGAMPGRLSWSRDGGEVRYLTSVGSVEHRGALVTEVPTDGGGARQVALGTSIVDVAWAPADWPLLYTTGPYAFGSGPIGPKPALWSVEGFGAPSRRLLDLPGAEYEPEYSPNGRLLTFVYERSERKPGLALWRVHSDGSQARPLVTGLITCSPSWSPDGRQVAFAAATFSGDRREHLYVVSADGGHSRLVSRDELIGEPPAWTPDGRWVTYATDEGEIKRVRPDGSGEHTIADFAGQEVRNLIWSPDGDHLAYSVEKINDPD